MSKAYSLSEAYEFLGKYKLSESVLLIGAVNAATKYHQTHLQMEGTPEEVRIWLKGHSAAQATKNKHPIPQLTGNQ